MLNRFKRLSHPSHAHCRPCGGFHGNKLVGWNKHSLSPSLSRDFKVLSTRSSSSLESLTSARESWTMPFWSLSKSLNSSETPDKEGSQSGLFLGFGTSESCLWSVQARPQLSFPPPPPLSSRSHQPQGPAVRMSFHDYRCLPD